MSHKRIRKRQKEEPPEFHVWRDQDGVPRISSRELARALGMSDAAMVQLIEENREKLERLGPIACPREWVH